MYIHPIISMPVVMLVLLIGLTACSESNKTAQQKNNDNTPAELTAEQKIDILQSHIMQLKQQVATLNRNQQGIAKKLGISTAKPQNNTQQKVQPSIDISTSASVGNNDAPVVLVEFTDLHCPFCARFNKERFPELEKQFIATGKLRFIGKHYPIVQLHKNAAVAAFALECARVDGDYKKAKAWLFNRGKNFNKTHLNEFTSAMNLNAEQFEQCVNSPEVATQINNDMAIARTIGINQTPSFAIGLQEEGKLVNWKIITGAESIENFGIAIEEFTQLAQSKG
jgi:protein-disulfide isomerase